MGSAIGAALSYKQYKDSKKGLKKQEARAKAVEAASAAKAPAEAKEADIGVAAEARRKRRGVQATYTTRVAADDIVG